ncbi:hypothetical protein, partial [Bradyrhizobium yuanmingense]|uniref:hypothetical protein n=1 Tax=Bradyrhizobium yuanmingense TaxID=108015 RepID=UPI001AED5794
SGGAGGRRRGLGLGGKRNGQRRRRQQGEKSPARPDGRGQVTEIHCGKPFLNGKCPNRSEAPNLAALGAALSPSIEADK